MRISDWSSDVCSSDLPVTLTMTSGARLTTRASRARVLPPWPARLELSERSNISAPRLFGSLVSFGLNSAASCPASKLLSKSLTGNLPIGQVSFRSGADTFDGRADRRAQVVDLLPLARDLRCIVRQRHLVSGSGDLIHVAPNALQRLTAIQQLFAQFAIDRRGNADVSPHKSHGPGRRGHAELF